MKKNAWKKTGGTIDYIVNSLSSVTGQHKDIFLMGQRANWVPNTAADQHQVIPYSPKL